MSKGTKIRSIRLPDLTYIRTIKWGKENLGTKQFSVIVRHMIDNHLDDQPRQKEGK